MTYYESEIAAPLYFDRDDDDAVFMIEKIRELGWPIIVVRFEDMGAIEAQERLAEINLEFASRGLPQFPAVRRKRAPHERRHVA